MSVTRINTAYNEIIDSGTALASSGFNVSDNALIVVGIGWEGDDTTVVVTDDAGNTYTVLTHSGESGYKWTCMAYTLAVGAYSNNTVTATLGAARGYRDVVVAQYSGIAESSYYDTEAGGIASSATSVDTASFNVAGAGVIVSACGNYNMRTRTGDADYTIAVQTTYMTLQERINTGSLTGEVVSMSNSGNPTYYSIRAAAFKGLSGPILDGTVTMSAAVPLLSGPSPVLRRGRKRR